MKRRLVAVTLSLVMTMATVSEAGAATFTSPDESAAVTQVTETDTEDVSVAEESSETDTDSDEVDIFSSGDDTADVPAQDQTDDIFTAGTDAAATAQQDQTPAVTTGTTDAEGAVVVKAEDWVSTEAGFKLRKSAQTQDAANTDGEDMAPTDRDTSADEVQNVADVLSQGDADVIVDNADATADQVDAADAADADTTVDTADDSTVEPAATTETEFYTEADGIVKISTEYKGTAHTGYYLFDENGILVTGQAEVKKEVVPAAQGEDEPAVIKENLTQSYFTTAEEAVVYEGCEGESVTPYTSTVGQQEMSTWKWTGTVFQYYDENGTLETVKQLEEKAKAAGTYTGYFEINGEYYCLDADGKPQTGEITLTVNGQSNLYYFQPASTTDDIPGKMYHDGWIRLDKSNKERWLYFKKGEVLADIGKCYKRGVIATAIDKKGTDAYLIDANGYILKSTMKKAANGAFYCTDKNGVIYRNQLVKYGNYRYYFTSNGKRATWTKRWAKVGTHYYYFGSTAGRVVEKHGWQKLVNTSGKYLGWLYFDSKGNHYTNKWTSTGYYFKPSGKLASGLTEVDGKKYLFESSTSTEHKGKLYKSTMIRYKKKWYLASSTGSLYKSGWKKYSGNYYYVKDYVIQTNQFMKKNGVNGYLDSTGKYTKGWVVVSNSKNLVRYIDPTGNGFAKNKSMRIDGILYYFDSNGYRITDLTGRYTGPYTLQVDRTNGVMTVYADSARTIPVKTIRVSVGLPSTPTPTGTYSLSRSLRWQPLMGPSWGQYGTHVDGAGQGGIFIHSVACAQANSYNLPTVEYNKLGSPASHGCIRTCVADAKWVYDHCNGATINIYDGKYKADDALKGPLGKKPLTPLKGAANYDPTDPNL